MSPIISKHYPPPPENVEDILSLASKKAQPIWESLMELMRASLNNGKLAISEMQNLVSQAGAFADHVVRSSVQFIDGYLSLSKFVKDPNPKLQGSMPLLFVLMILSMLYNAFVFVYMPAVGMALNSSTSLIFHAFVFLVMASLSQTVRTDPGCGPTTPEWKDFDCPPQELRERKHCSDSLRWCRKSDAFKPDRAHYCKVLERSVLRMDHHCPWLGTTIGFSNHKFFILFLAYANAACGILGLSIMQLLVHVTLPALTSFILIGAEGLALVLSTILGPFFLFHCYLLVKNSTTIEYCEGLYKDQPAGSMYDLGIFRNICSVMGANPLMWWLPVGRPMGDGITFQRRGGGEEGEDAEPGSAADKGGAAIAKDVETGSTLAVSGAAGEDFMFWRSTAEFKDDLWEGCKAIIEVEETFSFLFRSCCGFPCPAKAPPGAQKRHSKRGSAHAKFDRARSGSGSSSGSLSSQEGARRPSLSSQEGARPSSAHFLDSV